VSVAAKISTCVDCATTIIGECLRCPACHDRHAAELVATVMDDDVTAPRDRHDEASGDLLPGFLVRWVVVLEVVAIVALGLILGARACLP
jgi:hypothetical protein